jgi:hypothetical protein
MPQTDPVDRQYIPIRDHYIRIVKNCRKQFIESLERRGQRDMKNTAKHLRHKSSRVCEPYPNTNVQSYWLEWCISFLRRNFKDLISAFNYYNFWSILRKDDRNSHRTYEIWLITIVRYRNTFFDSLNSFDLGYDLSSFWLNGAWPVVIHE